MDTVQGIPTTLFTGFFGVGKTTTIKSMLERKPSGERWAILVNEFGDVSVDRMVMDNGFPDDGVVIQDIPGGCLCCMVNLTLESAIKGILGRVKPDRLLIEPTGMGHPAGIVEELRNLEISNLIKLKAIICLVDPRRALDPRIQEVKCFKDQINMADVLVASKADIADLDQLITYREWAHKLLPPKLKILEAQNGDLDLSLLELDSKTERTSLFPSVGDEIRSSKRLLQGSLQVKPGNPQRFENSGAGYQGCGWIFSLEDTFNREGLLNFLSSPFLLGLEKGFTIERLKGVFRVEDGWVLVDRVDDEIYVSEMDCRNGSRVELIAKENLDIDWVAIEGQFLGFIIPHSF